VEEEVIDDEAAVEEEAAADDATVVDDDDAAVFDDVEAVEVTVEEILPLPNAAALREENAEGSEEAEGAEGAEDADDREADEVAGVGGRKDVDGRDETAPPSGTRADEEGLSLKTAPLFGPSALLLLFA